MKIAHPPSPDPQRGWSKKGLETTSKTRKENIEMAPKDKGELLDEKVGFFVLTSPLALYITAIANLICQEHFDCGPWDDVQFPNNFPSEEDLPGFQTFVKSYFDLVQSISLDIMRACEVGWGMEGDALVSRCIPAASELRMLHYPCVSINRLKTGTIKRAWPHTDFGIITLLFQDSLGGLECEDRRKQSTFVPIIPNDENEMIVNTSDTLTRWTNGEVTGGVHQVNVPPGMRELDIGSIPERYSSVFFFKAHRTTSVAPLGHFVREKPAMYPDITALELHQERTYFLY